MACELAKVIKSMAALHLLSAKATCLVLEDVLVQDVRAGDYGPFVVGAALSAW
jgi:hypothetical protein